jgi:hypothetical protein
MGIIMFSSIKLILFLKKKITIKTKIIRKQSEKFFRIVAPKYVFSHKIINLLSKLIN